MKYGLQILELHGTGVRITDSWFTRNGCIDCVISLINARTMLNVICNGNLRDGEGYLPLVNFSTEKISGDEEIIPQGLVVLILIEVADMKNFTNFIENRK